MNTTIDLPHAALAILSALLYTGAAARQLLQIDVKAQRGTQRGVIYLALAAVAMHLLIAVLDVEEGNLNLGFYKVASLIFLTMGVISLATLLIRPLHMLIIVTFPLAALAVLVNAFAPATGHPMNGLDDGIILHVLMSLLAFAVLSLATMQGALVSLQTQRLRRHHTRGIVRLLPPLDVMEAIFYELLIAGTLLLTAAIISGGLFIDDLLGQKLVHKTVLTVIAWAIFATTLGVYWRRGWRIGTALTLVFVGYGCLVLGFFGSKLVVELLLN